MVSQAVSLKFKVLAIFKFCIWPPVNILLYLVLFYVLYGLVLFHKGDFCQDISRMIFKGGILGGVRKFHMDSYLNGTVPFDIYI